MGAALVAATPEAFRRLTAFAMRLATDEPPAAELLRDEGRAAVDVLLAYPAIFTGEIFSLLINIPIKNMMVGVMY